MGGSVLVNPMPIKVAGAVNVSVDFFIFPYNMLGDIELNMDTTNNHLVLTPYFVNPSFKKQSFWKSPTSQCVDL